MKVLTPGIRLLISMASAVVIIGGLHFAGTFLVPVVLAFFLAVLNLPFTKWLTARRVPHALAVLLTVALNLLLISGMALIGLSLASSFRDRAPALISDLYRESERWITNISDQLASFRARLDSGPGETVPELTPSTPAVPDSDPAAPPEPGTVPLPEPGQGEFPLTGIPPPPAGEESGLETGRKTLLEILNFQANEVIAFIVQANLVGWAVKLLGTSFLVFIIMVFILSEADEAPSRLRRVIAARGPDLGTLNRISADIQRYLAIKTTVSLVTGLLAWLLTWAFGLEFPLLWGLLAFLLNYIPTLGSIIAAIPPALLAVGQLGAWQGVLIILGYVCINTLLGNILEPMLMGRKFGLSTVIVILSVVFWGWLWGIVGTFLAVPLTMVLKSLLETSDDFRWIAVAMSKPRPGAAGFSPAPATGETTPVKGRIREGESLVER